jgi:histidine ammonia-lyase
VISEDNLIELNENLIRSHCVGTGNPISAARTRSLMAVRLNYFAGGYSGVSRKTVEALLGALNKNCIPVVPERGSVGAHDLAQLSHMTLGLLGEGQMWTGADLTDKCDAEKVLNERKQEKLKMQPKDAISLISGNAFAAALGAEAAHKANMIVNVADVGKSLIFGERRTWIYDGYITRFLLVAAMTIEGLVGTTDAFDPDIHNARPHKGQIKVARKIRSLLNNRHQKSAIGQSWAVTRVQVIFIYS